MPDLVLNSGKTGRIERSFATEDELYAFIIQWCRDHNDTLDLNITIGSSDLFCLTHGATYHIYADEVGVTISYVSG